MYAKESLTMAKPKQRSTPTPARAPKMPQGNDEGGRFVDRNLAGVNPTKQQFEPTEAEPVRQHARMAGAC
jgi:hypothetical protein